MPQIRVRFAPSPTGPLHIGGVRTALYNYLFARKNNGTFILRIEDTDMARYMEGAEEYILDSLRWCGISIDEGINEGGSFGPYRQSQRKEIYRQYADTLIDTGHAYYAFDTPEQLDDLRKAAGKEGRVFIYNAAVRSTLLNSLSMDERAWKGKIKNGDPYVIRFKMPAGEDIHFDDMIRGHLTVSTGTLDDKILFKSDGMPTYHLANIVDDHLMEISHVIRGEEWLPSLPLHFMLYRSFGWDTPLFAHLPLILKPDGKGKLSKRDGDKMGFPVVPLEWKYGETAKSYRGEGYFPEAFVNMLALLGWNPGTEKEIFGMKELINAFSIERIQRSGSRFDPDKARWFNHQYLMARSDNQVALEFREILRAKGLHYDMVELEKLVGLVKERVSFVKDIWNETDFFFIAPTEYNSEAVRKRWKPDTGGQLVELKEILEEAPDFVPDILEPLVKGWIEKKNYNPGTVINALRIVIVGASRGPGIFDIIAWIGREETLNRILKGVEKIDVNPL